MVVVTIPDYCTGVHMCAVSTCDQDHGRTQTVARCDPCVCQCCETRGPGDHLASTYTRVTRCTSDTHV